jgi:uncharacterized membrane protein HdeD (DUF308 family)
MRAADPHADIDTLTRNWALFLVRGLVAISFGVVSILAPALSLAALVLLFGAYVFVDGVAAIVCAIRRHTGGPRWWLLLLEGVAGVAAGVLTLGWPGITALVLLYLIAGWALATGVFEIGAAIRLRRTIADEVLLVLSGLASIGLGVLLILFPGPGALALILWIAVVAITSGILFVALAFRLRAWGRTHASHPQHPAPMPA